jgi:hypothetical protein
MTLRTHNLPSGCLKTTLLKSIKRCFKVIRNHFLYPGNRKKRFLQSRFSDGLRMRMAPRDHNLPSGRLNKRLYWSRWSDVSRFQRPIPTQFLHPVHRKKRIRRSRLNYVLSRRMALRFHSLPAGRLMKRVWWIRWSVVSMSWKIMWNLFVQHWHRKRLILPGSLSDDWCRRLTLTNHDQPTGSLKKRLVWSR